MKERPILFSGPMVRAILAGRKTQTRRVVKPQPIGGIDNLGDGEAIIEMASDRTFRCPYGQPGDRLWVRETFWFDHGLEKSQKACSYFASCGPLPSYLRETGERWTPAIHMPRWASRITLEITGVRVERLNDITEEDAKAEGVTIGEWGNAVRPLIVSSKHRIAFMALWDSINSKRGFGWDKNPWVWVIEFKRV